MTDSTMTLLAGRLNRSMLSHAADLSREEIRGLVDSYYQAQELRKASANQRRAVAQGRDANPLLDYVVDHLEHLEKDIQRMMDVATDAHVPTRWTKSFVGIGPTLSAGLWAHIDITIAKTGSAVWRFAGLDPTVRWEKGQRRPWNARLKVLCYLIGESFKKFSNHPHASLYSQLYRERKALEVARSASGLQAETAARLLAMKRWKPGTVAAKAYAEGKLPAGQLDARARRYAVKMFLEHFFKVCYEVHYGRPAPLPYIIEHDPVAHGPGLLQVPHWPDIPQKSVKIRHEETAADERSDDTPSPEELVQRRRRRRP